MVSHYHYRVQTNQTNLAASNIDFKTWVKLTYGARDPKYYDNPKMFMPQLDWITDEDGNILVKHICRFETLNQDFEQICNILGKQATLPHAKPSNRGRYQDYYDDETREIIASWFKKDIEYFGYSF